MHPTDDELLADLHGETPEMPGRHVNHVAECAECRTRLDALTREDAAQAALLRALDLPVPRVTAATVRKLAFRRFPRPGLVAAAAALTLITAAAAAAAAMPGSPLRSWFVKEARAPQTLHTLPITPTPVDSGRANAPAAVGVQVIPGDDFTIELKRPQTTGLVLVNYADQPFIAAQAFGGVVAYHLQTAKLVLDNQTPADRYEITLPRRLLRARVVVAGHTVFQTNPHAGVPGHDSITISLTPAVPSQRRMP